MEKEQKIKISLEGHGISFKKEISESLAGQIMSLCLSANEVEMPVNYVDEIKTVGAKRLKESAAEYMLRHTAKRNPDKILILAGFLRDSHNKNSFHPNEIKNLFRDAGEIIPANFTRDFNWVVSSGWLAPEPDKKGDFYITNTGSKVLSDGFPEDLVKKTKNKANNYRKKNKKR